jgi:hypothetical protein
MRKQRENGNENGKNVQYQWMKVHLVIFNHTQVLRSVPMTSFNYHTSVSADGIEQNMS